MVLVLALLAMPPAEAGKEEEPEVVSPEDKLSPNGDLLAAWLEHHAEGLKITFKVAGLGSRDTLAAYSFAFRLDGRVHRPAMGLDRVGEMRTDSGANPSLWGDPRTPARVDDRLLDPRLEKGSPAYLSAVVPWDLYPGLSPGAELEPLEATSSVFSGRTQRWSVAYDQADARAEAFVLAPIVREPVFPIVVPAWVLPTIVVGLTFAGLGGGAALAWTTRAKPKPVRAQGFVQRAPPPPPGRRFRRDPRL